MRLRREPLRIKFLAEVLQNWANSLPDSLLSRGRGCLPHRVVCLLRVRCLLKWVCRNPLWECRSNLQWVCLRKWVWLSKCLLNIRWECLRKGCRQAALYACLKGVILHTFRIFYRSTKDLLRLTVKLVT